jgi:ubiquinone/menaquinone biosynthesis C-methylase UbiE
VVRSERLAATTDPPASFDDQASAYEERAGLPEAVCREVVALMLDGAPAPAVVVDVGAGTGTLGRHLIAAGVRYVGLDVSRAMLAEFERSLPEGVSAELTLMDANRPWPIPDRSSDVILFSRSAHLLDGARTVEEVRRVARAGCRVFVGRVRRPRDSPGEQLKRTMQHMLRDQGVAGRNGERSKRDFLDALERSGARRLPEQKSASWTERRAPIDSLTAWKSKAGLGGRALDDALKQQILDELEDWARDRFGDRDRAQDLPLHYELEGAQFGE